MEVIHRSRRDYWIDVHRLRAWRAGDLTHIDLHLILPRDMCLEDAHREAKILEDALVKRFAEFTSVLIHMDPCEGIECRDCIHDGCRLEKHRTGEPAMGDRSSVSRWCTPELESQQSHCPGLLFLLYMHANPLSPSKSTFLKSTAGVK